MTIYEDLSCTMGVGDGSGKLFVHGNYDSIKAAQAIVLERDKLREECERLKATLRDYEHECETVKEVKEENERLGNRLNASAETVIAVQRDKRALQEENAKLTAEVEGLKIALEGEKYTCQNTFNHWQIAMDRGDKLLAAGRGLRSVMKKLFILIEQGTPELRRQVNYNEIDEALALHGPTFGEE